MKRRTNLFLTSVFIGAALSIPFSSALAAEIQINKINAQETGKVTIKGNIGAQGKETTLRVVDPKGNVDYIGQTTSGANGDFTFDFTLSEVSDGEYQVSVGGKDVSAPHTGSFKLGDTIENGGDQTGGDQTGGDQNGGDQNGGDQTGGDQTGGDQTGGDQTGGDQNGGGSTGGGSAGGGSQNKNDNGKVTTPPVTTPPVTTPPTTVPEVNTSVKFNDITNVPWAKEAIESLAAKGVIEGVGDGSFQPNKNVTRAEFIKMLIKAFNLEDMNATSELTDVKSGAWYYSSIATAEKLGIVKGKPDGSFGINDQITREDMALIVYRTTLYLKVELDSNGSTAEFADSKDISAYAKEAVTSMQRSKFIDGVGNNKFAPKGNTTRAQAATLIHRLFSAIE